MCGGVFSLCSFKGKEKKRSNKNTAASLLSTSVCVCAATQDNFYCPKINSTEPLRGNPLGKTVNLARTVGCSYVCFFFFVVVFAAAMGVAETAAIVVVVHKIEMERRRWNYWRKEKKKLAWFFFTIELAAEKLLFSFFFFRASSLFQKKMCTSMFRWCFSIFPSFAQGIHLRTHI